MYCDPIDKQYYLMQTTPHISDNGKPNTRVARVYLGKGSPDLNADDDEGRVWAVADDRGGRGGDFAGRRRLLSPPSRQFFSTLPGLLQERRPERVVVLLHSGGRREGKEGGERIVAGAGSVTVEASTSPR